MSNELEIDIQSEGAEETAYRRSDAYEFPEGKTLYPFSFVRKTTAIIMGLKIWKLQRDDLYTIKNPRLGRLHELLFEKEQLQQQTLTPTGQELLEAIDAEIEDIGSPEEDLYDNMMLDVAIVLWLCSVPDATVRKARRRPDVMEEEMDIWAEENRIFDTGIKSSKLALQTFLSIINDVRNSSSAPDTGGADNLDEKERGN